MSKKDSILPLQNPANKVRKPEDILTHLLAKEFLPLSLEQWSESCNQLLKCNGDENEFHWGFAFIFFFPPMGEEENGLEKNKVLIL